MADDTLREVWRERDAWANEARVAKNLQQRSRTLALCLGVAGAALGTLAGVIEQAAELLGLTSAVLLAVAAYCGRELLTPERESRWARARILVEALKRECWRFLMRVPPYDQPGSHQALRRRAADLVSGAGLQRGAARPAAEVELPQVSEFDDYIQLRILDQIEWYEATASRHRNKEKLHSRVVFALGGAAVVAGIFGARYSGWLAAVPVITTAAAALVAWIQADRIGPLVSLYQETSAQLRFMVADWRDGEPQREALHGNKLHESQAAFVEGCEEVMARENGAWRAEWLDEDKNRAAAEALARVYTDPEPKPTSD